MIWTVNSDLIEHQLLTGIGKTLETSPHPNHVAIWAIANYITPWLALGISYDKMQKVIAYFCFHIDHILGLLQSRLTSGGYQHNGTFLLFDNGLTNTAEKRNSPFAKGSDHQKRSSNILPLYNLLTISSVSTIGPRNYIYGRPPTL